MMMMSVYRLALRLLPAELRGKHGSAMEELFVRELAQAGSRGLLSSALASTAGVWDVLRKHKIIIWTNRRQGIRLDRWTPMQ